MIIIVGIKILDSVMVCVVIDLICDIELDFFFYYLICVFFFGVLMGE